MAIRGTELILFVRAQNQASQTLRRVAGDVRALTHARDLQARAERMAIRQAQLAAQQQRNLRRIADISPGGSRRLALDQRGLALAEKRAGIERAISNVETARMRTNTQLLNNRRREIRLAERARFTVPTSRLGRRIAMAQAANQRQYADLTRNFDKYSQAVTTAQRRLRNLDVEVAKLNADYEKQHALTTRLASDNELLARQSRALAAAQLEVAQAMKMQRLEQIQTAGRTVGHVGRAAQFGGLIGTAVLGVAAKQAANLNTEATRAATQTGPINSGAAVVVANAKRIQSAVIDMMQEIPANQQQLTDTFYNIYSSMKATLPQGIKLAKLFGQVWVAGGMQGDVNEVADALITLGNNWKISAKNMDAWNKLAASTLATVRFGRLTVEQYTQTMNQLAPAFNGAHQSIAQMNGAIAFNTRLMPSQRMSAAGLARMMEILGRFAAKPKAGFENLAKSIQDTRGNLLPLDKILAILIKRFPKLQTSGVFLTNFFKRISGAQGTVQARRSFQVLVRNLDLYRDTLRNTTMDQGEFRRSLTAMENSTGVQWAQMVNDMRAAVLQLGTAVLPVFLAIGHGLSTMAKAFNDLSPHTRKVIGYIVAFTAVGTLAVGTILAIVGALVALGANLAILRAGGGGIGKFSGMFGGGAAAADIAKVGVQAKATTGIIAKLGEEAGFISTTAVLKLGAVAAIPILLKYHDVVGQVVNQLGGFKIMVMAIGAGVTALTIARLTQAFIGLRIAMAGATAAAITFRAVLLTLAASGLAGRFPFIQVLLQGLATAIARVKALRLAILSMSVMRISIVVAIAFEWSKIHQRVEDAVAKRIQKIQDDVQGWENKHIPGADFFSHLMGYKSPAERKAAVDAAIADINRMHKIYQTAANQPFFHAGALLTGEARGVQATGQRWEALAASINMANRAAAVNRRVQANLKAQWQAMIPQILALKRAMEADPSNIDKILAYNKATDKLQKLLKKNPALYSAIMQSIDAMNSSAQEAVDNQKAIAEAAKQAAETAQNEMQQAAQNLSGIYQGMLDKNKAAFGELFQGPWMKSPFIQTGMEWGYKPGIEDMIKDLKAQRAQFNHFNNDLSTIAKRGGPKELVDQLRNLGPDALDKIEQLRKAAPNKFKEFITAWKRGQDAIQKATKIDFNAQLKQWFRYGKNIAKQIIFGLRSENVALDNAMRKYISDKFPGYIDEAVKKARAEAAKQQGGKSATVPPAAKPKRTTQSATVTNNTTRTYNIHAKDTDVSTALRKTKNFDRTHR